MEHFSPLSSRSFQNRNIQGGQKKPLHFAFSLKFVVFNIFSKFLRHIVAEYQEILPCKFQVCTTKTMSATATDSNVSEFAKHAKNKS